MYFIPSASLKKWNVTILFIFAIKQHLFMKQAENKITKAVGQTQSDPKHCK